MIDGRGSLFQPDLSGYLIVVVDNGSTDGSVERICAWVDGFEQVDLGRIVTKSKLHDAPPIPKPIPVYGDGLNLPDWLYVEDKCRAIDFVLRKGALGSIYNVGGNNEMSNIALAQQTDKPEETYTGLITFVPRPSGARQEICAGQ